MSERITDERLEELVLAVANDAEWQYAEDRKMCADTLEEVAAALRELQQLRSMMPDRKCPDCHYPIGFVADRCK